MILWVKPSSYLYQFNNFSTFRWKFSENEIDKWDKQVDIIVYTYNKNVHSIKALRNQKSIFYKSCFLICGADIK